MITSDKVLSDRLREMGYKCYVADATSDFDMSNFALHKAKRIIIDVREGSRTVYALLIVRKHAKTVPITIIINNPEVELHLMNLGLKRNEHIVNVSSAMAESIVKKI